MTKGPYPHSVRTEGSTLVKGYDDRGDATVGARHRNERAEDLGIKARYEATDIPCKRRKEQ